MYGCRIAVNDPLTPSTAQSKNRNRFRNNEDRNELLKSLSTFMELAQVPICLLTAEVVNDGNVGWGCAFQQRGSGDRLECSF